MIKGDLKTHADFSQAELKRVAWLIVVLLFWVSAGFIFQYKKHWFGNKQELFPSPLMPGFLRNQVFSDSSYYLKYEVHILAHSDTIKLLPYEFFNDQGLFKIQQIFKNKNEDWEPAIWSKYPNAERVCFIKDMNQFALSDKREEHFLIKRTEVCYERK